MKKLIMVILIATCLSGCATAHKLVAVKEAIQHDVNAGRVQGTNKHTALTWNLPNLHKGPYAAVDDFNVTFVEKGTDKKQNATFFLGKSRDCADLDIGELGELLGTDHIEVCHAPSPEPTVTSRISRCLSPVSQ